MQWVAPVPSSEEVRACGKWATGFHPGVEKARNLQLRTTPGRSGRFRAQRTAIFIPGHFVFSFLAYSIGKGSQFLDETCEDYFRTRLLLPARNTILRFGMTGPPRNIPIMYHKNQPNVQGGPPTISRVIAPVAHLFSAIYRGPITPFVTTGMVIYKPPSFNRIAAVSPSQAYRLNLSCPNWRGWFRQKVLVHWNSTLDGGQVMHS